MGRPRKKYRTTLVRFPVDIKKDLENKFPHNEMPQLIRVMYNTSALKLEGILRDKKKNKKKVLII